MDTRSKIRSADDAAEVSGTVVVGYFDPLLAAHVRRLEEIRRGGAPLTVLIADPADPLLPSRARAELVAAIAGVHCVIEAGADPARVLARLRPSVILDERASDDARTRELAGHISARHAGV